MFLSLLQSIAKILSDIWQYFMRMAGVVEDEQANSKKSDWSHQYTPEYLQPQHYNPNFGIQTNFRHRGPPVPMDVDRTTNQASQSSATTLPRPFYAAVRQTTNLVHRNPGTQKQKQSVVDILLQQEKEDSVQQPLLTRLDETNKSILDMQDEAEEPVLTPTDKQDGNDGIMTFEDSSILPESYYQPPPLPRATPNEKGGLRGSRPLVKLNRMSLITKMMREGKDGDRMGDYAPESQYNSINLNSNEAIAALGALGQQQGSGNNEIVVTETESSKLRNMASAYPTLSLKHLSLVNVIGGGGFGQVWKGTWGGTPVAVKLLSNLLLPQDTGPLQPEQEQLLRAFEEEVSMLAQLRHPNICLFLGVCLDPPHRAIVTELVSRGSLWDCLRVQGLFQQKGLPWPVGILRRILEGCCRGLIYLHSHQPPIIHRDLKSANLLLDETFNVKICDFGLARLRDYNTVLTANVGTIHWMAPEVLTGNQYNESADIYSMGIVMWEMFTGQCPYDGMKQVEVALSVVQKGLRPVIPTSCNTAQASIIRKCWDTDPTVRYTAEQLLQEVDKAYPTK